ncbi:O-glucosyltransferase rumi homolog [Carica papaya]|uniref:O-glucosyltransferase rumi homolog n=1 Tax=Carica papaya TaxID=3649 RepID=UPI000B8CB196|nr:O-glucosyltransferase rumi homolog [Carica papaya]
MIKTWASTTVVLCFCILLLTGAFICWIDLSVIVGSPIHDKIFSSWSSPKIPKKIQVPLNCTTGNLTETCPVNYSTTFQPYDSSPTSCPDYFRWIHEDLRPWKSTGISRDALERAKAHAHFRLIIIGGKAYVEHYSKPYQTRDVFTVWGILQLLRFYPGKVPDLELMFWCEDKPVIFKNNHQGPNATLPPVFHYCGHDDALDIVFPDWTFWGWAETNIRPWTSMLEGIRKGSKRMNWTEREPYAFWRGNPGVAPSREDLMKCNASDKHDWGVRLYIQDWAKETEEGYKNSNLEDQCTHRYKIYIEGAAWSVSEKYILACDSMTLLIKPDYYDFFMRSMMPMQHYWPIRPTNKCYDLKFAVEWGNNHIDKAQKIGKAGSKYIEKNLKMRDVYDYMFHLLNEYAKLLKLKPRIPVGAKEVCSETMACAKEGIEKEYMMESMVMSPSDRVPCSLPPPYDSHDLKAFLEKQERMRRKVEMRDDQPKRS